MHDHGPLHLIEFAERGAPIGDLNSGCPETHHRMQAGIGSALPSHRVIYIDTYSHATISQFSDKVMEFGRKLLVAAVHPKGVVSTWNATYPDLSIEARFAGRHRESGAGCVTGAGLIGSSEPRDRVLRHGAAAAVFAGAASEAAAPGRRSNQ